MEDEVFIETLRAPFQSWSIVGVLDGHGGSEMAKIIKKKLPEAINNALVGKTKTSGSEIRHYNCS